MSKQFYFEKFSLAQIHSLNVKTVQLSINTQFKCKNSKLVDWALSGATTPGQSGPGNDDNEEVLCIPQSFRITGTSPSDFLVSHPGHSLMGILPLCRGAVGVFYGPIRLGKKYVGRFKLAIGLSKELSLLGSILGEWSCFGSMLEGRDEAS